MALDFNELCMLWIRVYRSLMKSRSEEIKVKPHFHHHSLWQPNLKFLSLCLEINNNTNNNNHLLSKYCFSSTVVTFHLILITTLVPFLLTWKLRLKTLKKLPWIQILVYSETKVWVQMIWLQISFSWFLCHSASKKVNGD